MLAVTPDSANEVAKKYILPGHLVWLVVGDMSKVEAKRTKPKRRGPYLVHGESFGASSQVLAGLLKGE